MLFLVIRTTKRWFLQFFGFLTTLAAFPDYWWITLLRSEIYKTDYGFAFAAIEWLLFSFIYDVLVFGDRDKMC